MPSELTFLGGLLLGLASTLHCAAMCGGIASTLLFTFDTRAPAERLRVLLLAQAGKLLSYMALGILLGWLGSAVMIAIKQDIAYRLLQWAAAGALMWIGLSVAGLMPAPTVIDRLAAPLSARLLGLVRPSASRIWGPLAAGLAWGLMPCAMVYGALFAAMMSGTAANGGLIMAGFALGTLPAVTLTAFGLRSLAGAVERPLSRTVVGLSIAGFGFATVYLTDPASGIFCLIP